MQHKKSSEGEVVVKKDYSKKIILSLKEFKEKGHQLQTITIPPKTKQRVHKHFLQTEVWYILDGEASIVINNEEFISHAGDAFIADPGDVHGLWNKSDKPFHLVVFKINLPENDDDTQWLEE